MRILRWIGVRILAAGLGLALALLSICAIISATILNPGFAKTTVKNSGFYDNFIASSLKLASANLDDQNADMAQIITDMTPTVQQIITPQLLQADTELVIDGLGDWLSGKTEKPQFVIDTTSLKISLDSALATYFEQRINALPFCENYNYITSDDIITTGCRPPIEISQNELLIAASNFTKEIPMLAESELNADSILKDVSDDTWQTVPQAYKWARLAPYFFAFMAVVLAGVILLISHDRLRSLRRIGHIILANGVMLLIIGTVLITFFGHNDINFINSESPSEAAFIQEIVVPGIQAIFSTLGLWLLYFGGGYCLLSTACYVTAYWLKKRQNKPPKLDDKPEHKLEEPATEGEQKEPASEPKPESTESKQLPKQN